MDETLAVQFSINGKIYTANPWTVPVDTSLNTFIRDHAHLKGTKFMCREGGCGACVVTVTAVHPVTRQISSKARNSCLLPVFSCHGLDIVTVEGIGGKSVGSYHPIQRRLAQFNGSQCGYCSPGMVMSMYSLLASNGDSPITERQVEDTFDGNTCRCTGYRPILDAFKSLAKEPNVTNMVTDIEDLSVCSKKCPVRSADQKPVKIDFPDGRVWYKIYEIDQVFEVLHIVRDRPYMLVGGNTAHGVYRRSTNLEVFIDLTSCTDLHTHKIGSALTVGSNVTLVEFIAILQQATQENRHFQHFSKIVDHIRQIANVPVRNSGTLAGNLMLKHRHPEFPSDLFLILETVEAVLTIAQPNGERIIASPVQFLKLDMHKKLITGITLPPLEASNTVFQSYKIMPVAQNSRAYVNGAFLLRLCRNQKNIPTLSICYGGINPTFTHATKTERFLQGKSLFDNATLQEALQVLSVELEPDHVLPDASPVYRRQLALSLFYRFVLSTYADCDPRYQSGASLLSRPLSSGWQSFDSYPRRWPLTQNIPKIEGLVQCSGEAEFINDLPSLPNELHGAFVLATEIQSRLVQVDATAALQLPGVEAFFSAKNIPGLNNFMPPEMGYPEVEEIFCSGQVQFHGQVVGMVVAKTYELANQAASLVQIVYQRTSNRLVLPTVEDIRNAAAFDRVTDQRFDRQGAQYATANDGPIKLSGTLELKGQAHYSMETQVCVCVPLEDGMDVYSATQSLDLVHIAVSQALSVPQNRLNLKVRRVGGAYGAKITRASQVACACAIAAQLTQQPIRMILSMETNMSAIGKRAGSSSAYTVSVDSSGMIRKLTNAYIHDDGASLNTQFGIFTSDLFKNCYRTDCWQVKGQVARTDSAPNTWCRAPGTAEGMAMVENIMEHIAHVVGKDPLEVRMVNIGRNNKMRHLLPKFRKQVAYDMRRKTIEVFNGQNRWRKRGIAILPMQYPMEYSGALNVVVSIYHDDGSVAIIHGGIEMGQGINTKAVQVAAHVLGIPVEKIVVKPTSSLSTPNGLPSVHSRASENVAFAVKRCCETLLERLKPFRSILRRIPWEEVIGNAFVNHVDLSATYYYQPKDLQAYTIWGLACGEIEMDVLTGQVLVHRVDIVEDVGESLSPGIDVGQIEGAFVMGLGYYLTELLVYDPRDGALVNNRSWNYKVPGAHDIPVDFRVNFLRKSSNQGGVLRSKATGEPAFCLSQVVVLALRQALRSARQDAGLPDDWITMGNGMSPEYVFQLAGNSIDQYQLQA